MFSNSKKIVSDFFGNHVGKFLEIGANELDLNLNGEPCSHLLEKGWYGLYCEPNPFSLVRLIEQTKDYNVDILCAAVNYKTGISKFKASKSHAYLSSMDSDWMDFMLDLMPESLKNIPRDDHNIYINTVTPSEIFDKFGYDFDCISIDVELPPWHTHQILTQIDFDKVVAKMVVVETKFLSSDEYMRKFGFSINFDGPDTFYIR
jgi:hypothetical protein